MKVILLQDVKKQGKKDDIIEVSDGYAKNFLINKGLAVPCNEANKNKLDKDIEKRNIQEENNIKEAEELKKKIEKTNIKFNVKKSKDGRMFGTISSKQISEELKNNGYIIDKKDISCNHTIDSLGTHIVEIKLHKKVIANINVIVE